MTVPRVHNRHHHSAPSGAVYVGRGTKWGNSFQIGEHGTREQVLAKFADHVRQNAGLQRAAKAELAGQHLICSCVPADCHADLWLAIANDLPLPAWADPDAAPSNRQASLADW